MHDAARDEQAVARAHDPLFFLDPLLHLAFENVNDFIHLRMRVKRMPGPVFDVRAHEHERVDVAQAIFEIPVIDLAGEFLFFGFIGGDDAALGNWNEI